MKESDLKSRKETPEQELKRLRKENAKLKSQKEADAAVIRRQKKGLKRKTCQQ